MDILDIISNKKTYIVGISKDEMTNPHSIPNIGEESYDDPPEFEQQDILDCKRILNQYGLNCEINDIRKVKHSDPGTYIIYLASVYFKVNLDIDEANTVGQDCPFEIDDLYRYAQWSEQEAKDCEESDAEIEFLNNQNN
jgi:hypothetical protein